MGLYRDNGKENGNYHLGFRVYGNVDPWLIKLPPFKGLNIRLPILVPIKGRVFINQGSGLLWIVALGVAGILGTSG